MAAIPPITLILNIKVQGEELEKLKENLGLCVSCGHSIAEFHSDNGCYYTVTVGRTDTNLVCACAVPRREEVAGD